ncbi:CheR family methyltransferase [Lyngbya sp. CCY1209]|uniref:CheR family methyltransferase n=1 Tax=Lyngbya sp. CCY1209 TaxID=2886103 RepID=UPI002D20DCC3|nr:CheR family methyltransferase [Lyngbya sp. CCY1209]MEB3883289.1 tetratricopeptide repeat protein [Lyngbya sp. CCY1209]
MTSTIVQQLIQLVALTTGLHVRPQDYGNFSQKIWTRVYERHLSSLQEYYYLLLADDTESRTEWAELMPLLTTTETYFFRDRGQFKLLREVLLPELIEARRSSQILRLWSAGCSTGEEPYSLSILLRQLLPDWDTWQIQIIGTDVNEVALRRARQGLYSPWSFRMVDPSVQRDYFHAKGSSWQIDPKIQRSVTFFRLNLVGDNCANALKNFGEVDLILCRNVFVYFEKPYIIQVLRKFYQSLKPGGYLMTAHAELQGSILDEFQPAVFPESLVYRRPKSATISFSQTAPLPGPHLPSPPPPELSYPAPNRSRFSRRAAGSESPISPLSIVAPPAVPNSTSEERAIAIHRILQEARRLVSQKAYNEALKKVRQFAADDPQNFEAHYLMAEIHANLGEYDKATHHCQKALEIDSLSIQPYYLLLQIAEEKGDFEGAKILSKRIIYLSDISPPSISAHLELASLYEREGNWIKAKKVYATTLALLKLLPSDAPVEYLGQITVAELTTYLHQKLNRYSF